MPKEKDRSEYHVRSVQRALRILDCFSEHNPYLGVSEISEMLGIHKSTIHALLITLAVTDDILLGEAILLTKVCTKLCCFLVYGIEIIFIRKTILAYFKSDI